MREHVVRFRLAQFGIEGEGLPVVAAGAVVVVQSLAGMAQTEVGPCLLAAVTDRDRRVEGGGVQGEGAGGLAGSADGLGR